MSQIALTDASVISWSFSTDPLVKLLATSAIGNTRVLSNALISSGINGENYQMTFVQDAIGGRTVLFDTSYSVIGTFDEDPNKRTLITVVVQDGEADVVLTPLISSFVGITDHTLLSNIGTNTHAQIDSHIADATIHFTQASISITESQISDLGSYLPYTGATANVDIGTYSITANGVITENLDLDTAPPTPTWVEGRVYYDNINKCIAVHDDINGSPLQVGQEVRIRVFNNNGVVIPNGKAVTVVDVTVDGFVKVELAIASDKTSALNTVGIATHAIGIGGYGWVTTSGTLNDLDTSSLTGGSAIYLSETVAGDFQETRPLSPSYEVRMGGVIKSHLTDGKIYAELRIISNDHDNTSFFNGAVLEPNRVDLVSNGTTVNCALVSLAPNGKLSLIFDQEYVSVASGINIDLTLGTDVIPVENWVYINPAGVMTISTSGWPTGTQYTPVARVVVPSAVSAQLYGLRKVHAYTDHLSGSNGQGHLSHLNDWVRKRPASYQTGVTLSQSVAEGTSATRIDISYTSGVISQLHDHIFGASDTAIKPAFIINDPTTAYQIANGITSAIDEDSTGALIGNNKYYTLVVWGVVSEETKDCQLFFNVPSGSYTNVTDAITEINGYADYTIPTVYLGTGFLIGQFVIKRTTTTVTVEVGGTKSLLGSIPAVGGGSVIGGPGITTYDELSDTPITKVGQALKFVRVNAGETAHEYFDLDISGIGTNASAISTIQGEQTIQDSAIALNTAKATNATHTGEVTGATVLTLDPTAISNKTLKAVPIGTEEIVINDAGTLKKTTLSALGGASDTKDVTQVTHTFAVDDAIRHNGTIWVKAQADSIANAGSLGIITAVADADNFTYQFGGLLTTGTWTDGVAYFLSPSVAGAVIVEPTYTIGQVREYIGTGTPDGLLLEFDIGDEIVAETNLDAYFGRSELTTDVVDWSEEVVRFKTLVAPTTLTFTNLYVGVKTLEITGDQALNLPAFRVIGSGVYTGTVLNYIEVHCTDAVTPDGWIVISQEVV